jgi:hypothetical protein
MTTTPTPRALLAAGKLEEAAEAAMALCGDNPWLSAAFVGLVTDGPKGEANVERFIAFAERLTGSHPVP